MANAAETVLNNDFQSESGGSSNVAMAHLVVALAAADAMPAYTGRQPLEQVMQFCEATVGVESKACKALRQLFAGQLANEAKR